MYRHSIYTKLYIWLIIWLGIAVYLLHAKLPAASLDNWVLIYVLTSSVLLVNHFLVYLPPEGNSISMDSAIYLACLFTFGLRITLIILLLASFIYALYKRKIELWKHLFNFSMYSLMIIGSYYTFLVIGGKIGVINIYDIFPYVL
ncbi:hypothetical protein BDD39_000985 [Saccharococcus thermophilus]|uniref:Uncharacterized protein n=1 Tax=Saccharococcus thermophilus TaxID=29396 RepID=A0A846MIJ3_9BACL|nr:hypothetical protein [Saccharococcus thermophilus]